MTKNEKILFVLVFCLGFFFRTLNLNWDQNHHLHPDERFLTMVGTAVKIPPSLSNYLNPTISTLNPYNYDYNFFVYGTLPLTLVKIVSHQFNLDDYNHLTLVGRFISALLETGVLVLVFLITKEILNKNKEAVKITLWALFFYAIAVLPIQLAHFFAVESFLVFFSTLSLYLLFCLINNSKNQLFYSVLIGISTGLALACKVTAVFSIGIVLIGLTLKFIQNKKIASLFFSVFIFLLSSYFFLRLGDPRIFTDGNFLNFSINPQFISNLKELQGFNDPNSRFPPAIQWIKTKPLIYPLENLLLWGWGLPLGLIVILGVIYSSLTVAPRFLQKLFRKKLNPKTANFFLILVFTLSIFVYQGIQFSKNMRYFYPIYPFLAILGAVFFQKFFLKKIKKASLKITLSLLLLIYPLSFLSIYLHPHSRITASEWIYKNIPSGSYLAGEHWDDGLPISTRRTSITYLGEQLPLFWPDDEPKWQEVNRILNLADYIILSSNRLWGPIPKNPEIYPQTARYYQRLFAEKLGFTKVAQFTSFPCFPPIDQPWFCFPDQFADESFTVYDHPQVIIFQKDKKEVLPKDYRIE